jgi:hypothetical protein
MYHQMFESTFSVPWTRLSRQLKSGLEKSCFRRRLQDGETKVVTKIMRRLRCSVPWNY